MSTGLRPDPTAGASALYQGVCSNYTHSIFDQELSENPNYNVRLVIPEISDAPVREGDKTWKVQRNGQSSNSSHRIVTAFKSGDQTRCDCGCLFPISRGIPCRHVLRVLMEEREPLFQVQLFHDRWIVKNLSLRPSVPSETSFINLNTNNFLTVLGVTQVDGDMQQGVDDGEGDESGFGFDQHPFAGEGGADSFPPPPPPPPPPTLILRHDPALLL
jgi:hypothetical protein